MMRRPNRKFAYLLLVVGPLGAFLVWRQREGALAPARNLLLWSGGGDARTVSAVTKKGGRAADVFAGIESDTRGEQRYARNDAAGPDASARAPGRASGGGRRPSSSSRQFSFSVEGAVELDRQAHLAVAVANDSDNGVNYDDLSHSSGGAATTPTTPTTTICVRERNGVNPQQSIWKTLERYGTGRYRFVTAVDVRGAKVDGEEYEEDDDEEEEEEEGERRGWRTEQCDPRWPVALSLNEMDRFLRSTTMTSVNTNNVVLTYHRGDEWCRERDWSSRYRGLTPDFTVYWDSKDSSSPWNATSSESTAYLPLGPQFGFRPVQSKEIVPPQRRRYLLNFAGTLSTSKSRKRLARVLGNWDGNETRNNTVGKMMRSTQAQAQELFEKERLVVTPKRFQTAVGRQNGGAKGGYLSSDEYREALLGSIFTLCPAGHNPESYRLFEAAEAGSIPVVVLDTEYESHRCSDAFLPLIESGAPFVFLSKWEDLKETLRKIVSSPHLLQQRQEEVRQWNRQFMTRTSKTVERLLDSRLRTGPVDLPSIEIGSKATTDPVIVVGLNKAGTSTIKDYFVCGGAKTSHYYCGKRGRGPLCASMIKANILEGKPPLSGPVEWDVYAELNSHKVCYYPQMESLDEIHKHYPNATFILNLRNSTQWVNSVKNWGHGSNALPLKLVECDLPGLPAGVGSKNAELVKWFEMHTERVRSFVSRHPSHKLVEVTIDAEEAGQVMEDSFGISADRCWGHANVGRETDEVVISSGPVNCSQPPQRFTKIPQKAERHTVAWGRVCAPEISPSERVPAFLLIGAQKAGTTAFFQHCTKHPLIRRPKWKEFHYFAGRNMLDAGSDIETWRRNYRFMFGNVVKDCPSCITGEGTPQYMRFPHTVIPKVQSVMPWVKIIVLLRDPVARALSSYRMRKKNRRRKHPSFEELVYEDFTKMKSAGLLQNWTDDEGWVDFDSFAGSEEEENALRNYEMTDVEDGFSDRSGVITSGIIFRGLYELQLRQWVRAFGADKLFVINTDKDRVGPSVCGRFHEFVGVKSLTSRRLTDDDTEARASEKDDHDTEDERVQEYSSDISDETERKLKRFYSPYNRRLESILGSEWIGDPWDY